MLKQEDTHIDLHHTTEDSGIAIGECFKKTSNKFKGIKDMLMLLSQWMKP